MDIHIRVTARHRNGESMTATVAVKDDCVDWFSHADGEVHWDRDDAYALARDSFLHDLDFNFETVAD